MLKIYCKFCLQNKLYILCKYRIDINIYRSEGTPHHPVWCEQLMVSDAMFQGEDTEEGRPRPMAGFRVALVSSSKRKAEDVPEEEPPVSGMRRTVSAPPLLAPMAEVKSSSFDPPEDDSGCVYFPVSVDLDSLVDWKDARQGREENNNEQAALQKAALVTVNNKEVAVFKYGQEVIGE